jgi:hypothetical protein
MRSSIDPRRIVESRRRGLQAALPRGLSRHRARLQSVAAGVLELDAAAVRQIASATLQAHSAGALGAPTPIRVMSWVSTQQDSNLIEARTDPAPATTPQSAHGRQVQSRAHLAQHPAPCTLHLARANPARCTLHHERFRFRTTIQSTACPRSRSSTPTRCAAHCRSSHNP